MIDEDLIGGALVEEADGDQHISSMTTFELAQVRYRTIDSLFSTGYMNTGQVFQCLFFEATNRVPLSMFFFSRDAQRF